MPVLDTGWSDGLVEGGFGDPRIAGLVGWSARVTRMLEVEAALSRALAGAGIIPEEAANAIARRCVVDHVDLTALARAAAASPTPVIPLLTMLREGADDLTIAHLHHGATSQDIVDTAAILQVRDALDVIESDLLSIADRCAAIADEHRDVLLVGRTLGQQAAPVTMGLKAARWLGAVDRRIEALRWIRHRVLTVQLGGAAGTLAVYGERGVAVMDAFGHELGLAVPDLPWHAERDRIAELAGTLTTVVGTVEKIATDLFLLAQSEVDEARERPAKGPSSSAMPHKRNPAHVVAARAASQLALGELTVLTNAAGRHEHERAAGAWQAEWVALPSALVRTGGALGRLAAALDHLEVDAVRATDNLTAARGVTSSEALATALTTALGRSEAQRVIRELVDRATSEGRHLVDVALEDDTAVNAVGTATIRSVLDPRTAISGVAALIDRALATHRTLGDARPGDLRVERP